MVLLRKNGRQGLFIMKKGIVILLVLALTFAFSSCSPAREKAQDAVVNAIEAVKEQNTAEIEKYFGSNISSDTVNEAGSFGTDGVVALLVKNISYEILDAKEDGDSATVSVSVTNTDMSAAMSEYISKMFSVALQYAFLPEEEQPSDEEMQKIYEDAFSEVLSGDISTVTKTVDVPLTYSDGSWKIGESDELADALFGGLLTYAKNLESAFSS